jgi:predicted Zn-dependent protease
MRAQTAIATFTCWLLAPALTADAQPRGAAAIETLRYFDDFPGGPRAVLRALRPTPIAADDRARALALLPERGELQPDMDENVKLSALEVILVYHERREVFDIKVIDLPQAIVALHQRAVLLVSRPALRFLSASELQALVAHEVGHEYFWRDYETARERRDRSYRQELELKCDGIAVLTLTALGLDPTSLADGLRKIVRFNKMFGTPTDADDYPSLQERRQFVSALAARHRR